MERERNKPYMKPRNQSTVGEGAEMSVKKRTTIDENGKLNHILEFEEDEEHEDVEFDTIVVQFDPNDEDVIICKGYKGDELAYQNAFRQRNLSFDPISVIGRGESAKMQGLSDSPKADGGGEDKEIPSDIATAFNTIGFSVVPEGDWWIDE